jgi:hypothetical protein
MRRSPRGSSHSSFRPCRISLPWKSQGWTSPSPWRRSSFANTSARTAPRACRT